jgi:hypothetical protein
MRRLRLAACGLSILSAVGACKDDDGGSGTALPDTDATTTGDGGGTDGSPTSGPPTSGPGSGGASDGASTGGTTGGPPPLTWSFDHVFGRANVDDDDDNGKQDWLDPPFDGDNELVDLVLPAATLDALPPGARVVVSLAGAGQDVRAWLGGQVVLGHNQNAPLLEHSFTPTGGDVRLQFEFEGHHARAALTIAWSTDDGDEGTTEVLVRAAPLITNHHAQPTERVWVVDVNGGQGYNNQSMIQAFEAVLGDRLTRVPADDYEWDVWIQDEFEWATADSPGGRMDVVIDSIRNRGLDPMPEDRLVGPDYVAQAWGNPADRTTYDSFGNLDASPPVTVGGTPYPFGRIYYGRRGGEGLDGVLADYLAAQEIQKPFEVDTTWLCVGHVDEFSGIIPDPGAPKGFRLLFADVPAMYAILDALPENTQLARYAQDYGYGSVGELTNDPGLRALNEDIQADHLDPILAVFKQELGLDDADIIKIPTLWEQVGGCGALTLVPGAVNFTLVNVAGEPVHMFVPDPFLRPGGAAQAEDPLIADFAARIPDKTIQLHFVDNWNVYHVNRGEVHCGTNVQRAPLASWWENQ